VSIEDLNFGGSPTYTQTFVIAPMSGERKLRFALYTPSQNESCYLNGRGLD